MVRMTHPKVASLALVGLLAVGLVAFAAGAAVAQPPSSPGKPTTTPSHSHSSAGPNSTHGPPPNATSHRPADAPMGPAKAGRVSLGNGTIDGRYVDAEYDEASGLVTSFMVAGVEYFSQIDAPANFTATGHGAQVRLEGEGFTIAITDSPSGLLRIRAPNASVELQLADGVDAAANGTRVQITAGNESAVMTNASLDGQMLSVESGLFMLHGKSVASAAHSYEPSQAMVDEAVANGHVAARIEILEDGSEVLDYQGASVNARRNPNGSHTFVVDANFSHGKAFVVDFAPGLFRAEELGVLYFDEVNGTLQPAMIQRADSLADVLLLEAGEGPEFWHVDELAGDQVIVAISHFSVHAFDVYAVSGIVQPVVVMGILSASILVVVVAVSAVRGRAE